MQSANILRKDLTDNQLFGLMTRGETGLGGGVFFGPQFSATPTPATHQSPTQMGNDAGLKSGQFGGGKMLRDKFPFEDKPYPIINVSEQGPSGLEPQGGEFMKPDKRDAQKLFLDVQHPPGTVGFWEAYV